MIVVPTKTVRTDFPGEPCWEVSHNSHAWGGIHDAILTRAELIELRDKINVVLDSSEGNRCRARG